MRPSVGDVAGVAVSKDLPPILQGLPRREGPRPGVEKRHPCPQVTQGAPAELREALVARARSLPGTQICPPRLTVPGADGLALAEEFALGQAEAFIMGREFACLRGAGDGSVHLTLYPEWGAEVLRQGWAEIFPLALYGLIPPQNTIVYAPRDEAELEVVWRILTASYFFARGELVELR
jgi:hypothetical protein